MGGSRRSAAARGLAIVGALVASMTPAAAHAQMSLAGQTAGGAYYQIQVPPAWNGKLVIWNHGFDLSPVGPVTGLGPLVEVQLIEGFAVAASSYRQSGWAVFKTLKDLRALVSTFRAAVGEPSEIIVYGGSLGGLVTAQAIEKGIGGNVTGAGILCGAVAGSRNWDGALDIRLIYDAVCNAVPGAAIPGGAEGLPAGSTLTVAEILDRVDVCTGASLAPRERSREQQQRLDQILATTQVPAEFLTTDLWYTTFAMSDLVHDRQKMRGKVGTTNVGVQYPDPAIDAAIERVRPRAGSVRRLGKNYTPTGRVGATKVLAMHTDQDGLVIVENLGEYAELLPPDQVVAAVVVEEEPSHCGFSLGEGLAAWEVLLAWLGGGPQPTASDLQANCELLVGLGATTGPCRFDPDFVIPDMDTRIAPR